jgi:hypothetical protein
VHSRTLSPEQATLLFLAGGACFALVRGLDRRASSSRD